MYWLEGWQTILRMREKAGDAESLDVDEKK